MSSLLEYPEKNENSVTPKYQMLAERLRQRIAAGELQPGDRLPTFAEMRSENNVTSSTVERMYGVLEQDGLIERQPRRGLFVAEPKRVLTGNIGIRGNTHLGMQLEFFYSRLNHGLQEAADRHGRRLLWQKTPYNNDNIRDVDGLLLSGHPAGTNNNIVRLKPAYMPAVSLFILAEGINSVVVDDYGAAKIAARHLLELGHHRIACFMNHIIHTPQIPRNRIAGYQDALQEAGIIFDPRWLRQVHYPEISLPESVTRHQSLLQWSREQMQIWLEEGWRDLGCTAILAQNDHIAIGIMQVLQEANIDVPGEVSVMGFDGTELCDHTTPRLSSVQLPLEQIGSRAVDLLVEQIENGQPEEQIIVLPAKLRAGASTAPCRV